MNWLEMAILEYQEGQNLTVIEFQQQLINNNNQQLLEVTQDQSLLHTVQAQHNQQHRLQQETAQLQYIATHLEIEMRELQKEKERLALTSSLLASELQKSNAVNNFNNNKMVSTTTQLQQLLDQQDQQNFLVMKGTESPELVMEVILQGKTPPPNVLLMNPQQHYNNKAIKVLAQLWAETTLTNRKYLWMRFNKFRQEKCHKDTSTDWALLAFLESIPNLQQNSKLQYATSLAAIHKRLSVELPLLRMYNRSLLKQGAAVPINQATPITVEQILEARRNAFNQSNWRMHAILFLMWKSVSRHSDVARLQKQDIVAMTATTITIKWNCQNVKNLKGQHNRIETVTVVEHEDDQEMQQVRHWINQIPEPHQFVCPVDIAKFNKFLKEFVTVQPKPNMSKQQQLDLISSHSIKRGAVTYLVRVASESNLDPAIISRIAKHRHWFQPLAEATLGYNATSNEAVEALATLLQTQKASRLLP